MDNLDKNLLCFDCHLSAENSENIFVAISVNEKSPYLNPKFCNEIIKYIMERKKEKLVIILIADKIAHYNIQAFNRYKSTKAINEALKLGNQISELFDNSLKEYGDNKIKICRWDCLKIPDMILDLEKYEVLDQRVSLIADIFLKYRGQNLINKSFETKINLIKKYIYSELPIFICGVYYDQIWYRLMYYSGSIIHLENFAQAKIGLHNLTRDIINNDEFVDVKNFIMKNMNTNVVKISGFIGIDIDKF